VAATALLLATATGCRPDDTGAVRVVAIGERQPRLADPAAGTASAADLLLIGNAAQGLVRFDAAGNIVPGLAERWAVSNDGLSYVFRLRKAEWSDGRRVRARDVVRLLNRQLARGSRNPLKDTAGAVAQIVAMTDRVVAIELDAPRPHLLQLLAQPEFGLVREGGGTGPFRLSRSGDELELVQVLPGIEEEEGQEERVRLSAYPAEVAVREFAAGRADLVLGGTSADLALALGARLPRGSLRIDPVAGLFGLVPARATGPAADQEVRALLDEALDRPALVAALGLPQLQPRASLLQFGLDGIAAPAQPEWAAVPLAERRAGLMERARRLFPGAGETEGAPAAEGAPAIRVALPAGPGGSIILERLKADWQPLGLSVVAAPPGGPADFRWVDLVAPSTSPAWFLRSFRCEAVPVCSEDADRLLDAARVTGFAPQRSAFFAEAERRMREQVLFLPVAAPIRWSLAAGEIEGFAENRFARHTLTGLRERAGARD
jgi:peptide/nickel transport system substrate-binding protein